MGTPRKFLWTDEAVADLRKRYSKGQSATEIAKALPLAHGGSVTRNAVIGKLHRLGLKQADLDAGIRPKRQPGLAPIRKFTAPSAPRRLAEPVSQVRQPARRAEPQQQWVRGGRPPPEGEPAPSPLPPERPGPVLVHECDHTALMCTWPIGDPKAADFRRCGVIVAETDARGRRYCPAHREVAFKPLPAKAPKNGSQLARSLRRYVS